MEDNDRDLGVSVYEKVNARLENIEIAESGKSKAKSLKIDLNLWLYNVMTF